MWSAGGAVFVLAECLKFVPELLLANREIKSIQFSNLTTFPIYQMPPSCFSRKPRLFANLVL